MHYFNFWTLFEFIQHLFTGDHHARDPHAKCWESTILPFFPQFNKHFLNSSQLQEPVSESSSEYSKFYKNGPNRFGKRSYKQDKQGMVTLLCALNGKGLWWEQ